MSTHQPHGIHRSFLRYGDFLRRHDLAVLLGAFALALTAGMLAARLELRTNIAELLPSRDPAVEELRRTGVRLGGTQVLQIAIESGDREANLALAGEIAARLRRLPPEVVRSVTWDVRAERRFFLQHRFLYADLATLEQARDALRSRIQRAKNPMLVDLLDEGDSFEELSRRLRARASQLDRFPTGYFEGDGGRGPGSLVVIVVRPPGDFFGERMGERLHDETLRIVRALDPERFACRLHGGDRCEPIRVGLTGDVMSALDERAALENDLAWATAVCLLLVGLAVTLYYGHLRSIFFVGLPAVVGVGVAFGAAKLLYGYLNSSTAFMGSIVAGNGINFAIVQYARFQEERRAGRSPREATAISLAATLRPTAVAALGAAAAYGSLIVTRFRGFSQFGVIGGIGMLAAWLATVVVLPALCARFDGHEALPRRARLPSAASFSTAIARAATRRPGLLLGATLAVTAVALAPLPRYLRDPFEYDFTHLRNRRSLEGGAGALAPRVDRVFGRTLTPAAIIAERADQVEPIRRRIRQRDAGHVIADVRTIDDYLPGTPAEQAAKLSVLAEVRRLLDDPALELLPPADRDRLRDLRPPEDLRLLERADLPFVLREPFTERDGRLGRVLLVYHDERTSVWDGRNLMRIADLVGEVPLPDGAVVRSSGHAVVFAAMIRSVTHDAPRATALSLLGVAVLVTFLARGRRGATLVVGTLVIGVAWMLGVAAWLGVRTNFLNFIALPITFGIGVDYGINIYLRYRIEGPGGLRRAVQATGGAVALCSLTTIIGYGALLVADNQALRSFGEMAILGEIACLLAAVAVMPAWIAWRERRASRLRAHGQIA